MNRSDISAIVDRMIATGTTMETDSRTVWAAALAVVRYVDGTCEPYATDYANRITRGVYRRIRRYAAKGLDARTEILRREAEERERRERRREQCITAIEQRRREWRRTHPPGSIDWEPDGPYAYLGYRLGADYRPIEPPVYLATKRKGGGARAKLYRILPDGTKERIGTYPDLSAAIAAVRCLPGEPVNN